MPLTSWLCERTRSPYQELLLHVGGGVAGHAVQVHQRPQHAVPQHRQVAGDGRQGVAHQGPRLVVGRLQLAQQELHGRLAEVGPALQQAHQRGERSLGGGREREGLLSPSNAVASHCMDTESTLLQLLIFRMHYKVPLLQTSLHQMTGEVWSFDLP